MYRSDEHFLLVSAHIHTHKHRDTRTQIYLLRAYTNTLLLGYRTRKQHHKNSETMFLFFLFATGLKQGVAR